MHEIIGTKVRDRLTGFEGYATSRTEYLLGCAQVHVQPSAKSTGEFQDGRWFDEPRLEVLDPRPNALDGKPVADFKSAADDRPRPGGDRRETPPARRV